MLDGLVTLVQMSGTVALLQLLTPEKSKAPRATKTSNTSSTPIKVPTQLTFMSPLSMENTFTTPINLSNRDELVLAGSVGILVGLYVGGLLLVGPETGLD